MGTNYANVNVFTVNDDKQLIKKPGNPFYVKLSDEQDNLLITLKNSETSLSDKDEDYPFYKDSEISKFGNDSLVVHNGTITFVLQFDNLQESTMFNKILTDFKQGVKASVFSQRTDEASASQYFQFYGYLSQQQNMMQDYIRTSTYQRAILGNTDDFRDAVVLDVGAGSGILSFFAAQAGARKVYAVEASSMAKHAEQLVFHNKLQNKIVVIPGKIEEITLPEKVDIIISEPMGYMLFNERMLETYLHAKKWLQPQGKMFPTLGDLHIAPFSDAALYMEQLNKANFWYQENFHGVDLTVLRTAAVKEYFRQPVVDTFDIRICMARSHRFTVDFQSASETDLHHIEIPFSFVMLHTADVHGLAFWFDVAFIGQNQTVWLSTSPTQPLTHWYQVRCLVDTPIFCQAGQILTGRVALRSNKRQSYDVDIELNLEGTLSRATNSLDLKNPYFRYTGQTQQPPPGAHETSPTEQYWQSLDNNQVIMNGNSGVAFMDMSGIHPMPQTSGQIPPANVQQQQPQQGSGNLNMMPQQQAQLSAFNKPIFR